LVAALAVNDAHLRSLEWRQRVTAVPWPGKPAVMLETGVHAFDETGVRFCHGQYGNAPEEPGPIDYHTRYMLLRDGVLRGMQQPDAKKGLVRTSEGTDWCVYPTPEVLLGRWLDASCDYPLSEVLRRSRKMQVIHEDDRAIRLRAWRTLNGCASYIDVDCDKTRDFIPIRIEYSDVLLGCPVATFEATEFTKREGVWIPTKGTKTVWDRTWTDDQMRQMLEAVAEAGYKQPWNPDDEGLQAAHRRAIGRVFGPAGIPVTNQGLCTNVLEVTDIISVNKPLSKSDQEIPYPEGWRMFNMLLDVMENPDGSNRVSVPRYSGTAVRP
jgi:hypothetical protein